MKNSIRILRRESGVEKLVAEVSSVSEGCKIVNNDITKNGYDKNRFLTYNKAYGRLLVDIGNPEVSYMFCA